MNLKEVLAMAFRTQKKEGFPATPKIYRALVTDLCGDDYEALEAANRFLSVDRKVGLFEMALGGNTREEMLAKYQEASTLLSEAEYAADVDILLEVAACGGNCASLTLPASNGSNVPNASNAVAKVQNGNKKAKSASAGATNATGQGRKKRGKKSASRSSGGTTPTRKRGSFGSTGVIALAILGAVMLFAGMLVWLVIGASSAGQHVIGAIGGGLIYFAFFVISSAALRDEEYVLPVVLIGVQILLNAVLGVIFPSGYRIVAYWLEGYALLASGAVTYLAFESFESEMGVAALIECVFAVISIALFILCAHLPWAKTQHVIGSIGGLALFGMMWMICLGIVDGDFEDTYLPHQLAIVVVIAVTLVLRFLLPKEAFFTIAMWWGSLGIVSCIVACCLAIADDYDGSIIPVLEAMGAIGALVAMALV